MLKRWNFLKTGFYEGINYASGIPFFSVVVGLVQDGQPIVGVNHDPLRREMFEAERGVWRETER